MQRPTFFGYIAGEGHGVAEDVDSAQGWERQKLAYRIERPNKDQEEQLVWFENQASNEERRGLANGADRLWSKLKVNLHLGKLAGKGC